MLIRHVGRQRARDGLHATQHDGPPAQHQPAGGADTVPVRGGAALPAAAAEHIPEHLTTY